MDRELRMRILLFSLEFVDPLFSGNGVLARTWVRILDEYANCEVLVVCAQPAGHKTGITTRRKSSAASDGDEPTPEEKQANYYAREILSVTVDASKWGKLDRYSSWREYARGSVALKDRIRAFGADVALGVDWSGAYALAKVKENVPGLAHLPFVYLNFRIFTQSTGISSEDKEFYEEMESKALGESVGCIALCSYDAGMLRKMAPHQVVTVLNPVLRNDIRELALQKKSFRENQLRRQLSDSYQQNEQQIGTVFRHNSDGALRPISSEHLASPNAMKRDRSKSFALSSPNSSLSKEDNNRFLERNPSQASIDKRIYQTRVRYEKVKYGFGGPQNRRHRDRDLAKLYPGMERNLITCCCRVCPEKNVMVFVETMERLARFLMESKIVPCIVGPPTEKEFAEQVYARLRLAFPDRGQVRIIPKYVHSKELGEIFSHTLLNFHPATYEAYGMTMVEAAAYGAPTILDGGGAIGAADLLRVPRSAIAVDMRNSKAVAGVIRSIVQKDRGSILELIGTCAQEAALGWNDERFAKSAREQLDLVIQNAFRATNPKVLAAQIAIADQQQIVMNGENHRSEIVEDQSSVDSSTDEIWPWVSILEWVALDACDGVVIQWDLQQARKVVYQILVENASVYKLAVAIEGKWRGTKKTGAIVALGEEQKLWASYFAGESAFDVVMQTRYRLVPARIPERGFWYGLFELIKSEIIKELAPQMSFSVETTVKRLAKIVQQDRGDRGIKECFKACGEYKPLLDAARDLLKSKKALILTGFPCVSSNPITRQETDGPPGAAALTLTLHRLGVAVIVAIEQPNAAPVQACIGTCIPRARVLWNGPSTAGGTERTLYGKNAKVRVESFPCIGWGIGQSNRIVELLDELDRSGGGHLVAIERAGPNLSDGECMTMMGKPLDKNFLAPLHELMEPNRLAKEYPKLRTTGIGDGGNEVGMGAPAVLAAVRANVANGERIACKIPCDNAFVCDVSNWGAYALCAALTVVAIGEFRYPATREQVDTLFGTTETCLEVLKACCAAGAWDGVTCAPSPQTVDGFTFEQNLEIVKQLRDVLYEFVDHLRFRNT